MTIQEECALSFYKKIAEFQGKEHVCLVQHVESNAIFVRKELTIYNKSVYEDLQQLSMPEIPHIYECIEAEGKLILIEEFVQGQTLDHFLEERIEIEQDRVIELFLKICSVISALHDRSEPILHRDIKPSNIMVMSDGSIKLVDFNTARHFTEGQEQDTVIIGTRKYAAPEQYGYWQTDVRTDIFALGVLLNFMLTGDYPDKVLASDFYGKIVRKCTAFEPNERYQSVQEIVNAIKEPLIKKQKNAWRKVLPPGFRTGKIWKMIIGAIGYVIIVFLSMTEFSDSTGNALMGAELWANRATFFAICILCIIIWFNYMNIHKVLPLLKSKRIILKLIGYFLYTIVVIFLPVAILVSINF